MRLPWVVDGGQYRPDAIDRVRATVGTDKVLLGLSGGVDSSVVAALLHRAIGEQLTCVFVDNGLLRLHEGDHGDGNVRPQYGGEGDSQRLRGAVPGQAGGNRRPRAEAQVIGNTFIEVFDTEAARLQDVKWLAQGTIYPDVIESAGSKTGKAHVISRTTTSAACPMI